MKFPVVWVLLALFAAQLDVAAADRTPIGLPDRSTFLPRTLKVFDQTNRDLVSLMAERGGRTDCPHATRWLNSILGRLLEGSGLAAVAKGPPVIFLEVECHNASAIDARNYFDDIIIPAGAVLKLGIESEDLLAVIVAHELSHGLLLHGEAMLDQAFRRSEHPIELHIPQEIAADETAVRLMANAGYDPFAVPVAFRRIARLLDRVGSGGHGSSSDRIARARRVIRDEGYRPRMRMPGSGSLISSELRALRRSD